MTDIVYRMDGATDPTTVNSTGTAAAAITSTPAGFAVTATSSGAGADMRLASSSLYKRTGLTALKITTASGVTNIIRLPFGGTTSPRGGVEFYHGADTLPTAGLVIAQVKNTSDQRVANIGINTNGSVYLQDSAGTTIATTAAGAWAAGRRNRIALVLDSTAGTAAGTATLRVFNDDSTTPTGAVSVSTANFRAATPLGVMDIGSPGTATFAWVEWYEDVQMGDGRTTEFGPYGTNAAPTVSLGAAFSADPNLVDAITLTATATDSDGTIASYLFEDITGAATTVAGSGNTRSITIPRSVAGTSRTYRVTVTDNGGATGTATVVVTVLPHTRWLKTSGSLAALRRIVNV